MNQNVCWWNLRHTLGRHHMISTNFNKAAESLVIYKTCLFYNTISTVGSLSTLYLLQASACTKTIQCIPAVIRDENLQNFTWNQDFFRWFLYHIWYALTPIVWFYIFHSFGIFFFSLFWSLCNIWYYQISHSVEYHL